MKHISSRVICLILALTFHISLLALPLWAHFQVVLPSKNLVSQGDNSNVELKLCFAHPFEQQLMNMERPRQFGVVIRSEKINLLDTLRKKASGKGLNFWQATYKIKRPGDHVFFVEPAPYWEPAEDKYIIHYAKTVVNAYGLEDAWHQPLGLRMEIVPLTRPYGLWAGNLFQGKVLFDGKPLKNADVEVEYYNENLKIKAPSNAYVTQVVRTDERGIFTYAMPWEGWWGFAALTEAPERRKSPDGKRDVATEIGAVFWVKTEKGK